MDELITLPRSVVAALVDPDTKPYMREACLHCGASFDDYHPEYGVDWRQHTTDCPVRLAQEALATPTDAPAPNS